MSGICIRYRKGDLFTVRFTYEITPRPESLGGGWRLRLRDHGNEVGGALFPIAPPDADAIAAWWNGLDDAQRVEWLDCSCATTPAGAHHAYQRALAYGAAETMALTWLRSQERS